MSSDGVDAVCLDIGEVVIDETRVWSTWGELLGVPPFTLMAAIGAAIADGESHTAALARFGGADWHDLVAEHERRLGALREEDLHLDARDAIAALRSVAARVVLAGNQPARRTPELHALGLGVDDIVTSDELHAQKPDRSFFDRLLAWLDDPAPQRVVYVGDRVDNDVRPARAAGLRPVWLLRGPWALLAPDAEDDAPTARDLSGVVDVVRGWTDERIDELEGRG